MLCYSDTISCNTLNIEEGGSFLSFTHHFVVDVSKRSGQGNFEDRSGTCPGHVRDMSGTRLGHVRDTSGTCPAGDTFLGKFGKGQRTSLRN